MATRHLLLATAVVALLATGCRKPKQKPADLSGAVGTTTLTSAPTGPKASARVQGIFGRLASPDEITRDNASKELLRLKREDLEIEDSLALVQAATKTYPKRKLGSTAADLIRAAAIDARKEHVDAISTIYARLDDLARTEALALLSRIDDRAASEAFIRLIKEDVAKNRTTEVRADSLEVVQHQASVLFPELMKHARGRAAGGIYSLAIVLLEAAAMEPEPLAPYTSSVVATWNELKTKVSKERWEERRNAAYALDLMAWLPKAEVLASLKEALTMDDPLLAYWGSMGLIAQGQRVSAKQIDAIASHPELRGYLYERLKALGSPGLFPAKHRNQKSLAEAEMALFLQGPTQLAKPPSAIELVDVVSERVGRDVYDLYLFRFRVDAPSPVVAEGRTYEFCAGLAGPFKRGVLSTRPLAQTSSTYRPFMEKSIPEHKEVAQEKLHSWITGDEQDASD
jgi:hypothetical protein